MTNISHSYKYTEKLSGVSLPKYMIKLIINDVLNIQTINIIYAFLV